MCCHSSCGCQLVHCRITIVWALPGPDSVAGSHAKTTLVQPAPRGHITLPGGGVFGLPAAGRGRSAVGGGRAPALGRAWYASTTPTW